VETEIYLLTTQFLDLRAAAGLSVLQLLVVSSLLYLAQRTRGRREQALDRNAERESSRPPRRRDVPALTVTAVVLVLLAAPLATLVVRSLQVDGVWSTRN
jgi:thiamine transport system permease protein